MRILSDLPWASRQSAFSVASDEKLIRASLPHWIRYVAPACIYAVMLLFSFSLLGSTIFIRTLSAETAYALFFCGLAVLSFVQHWFFHTALSIHVSDIILTNKRILNLVRNLWFKHASHDVALTRINEVDIEKQGLLQNILDYGDLLFDTGGSTQEERSQVIHSVPSPQEWADDIVHAMRQTNAGRPPSSPL